jgi:hypothetical protein
VCPLLQSVDERRVFEEPANASAIQAFSFVVCLPAG